MPFEPRNSRYEKKKKGFLKRDKPKVEPKKEVEKSSKVAPKRVKPDESSRAMQKEQPSITQTTSVNLPNGAETKAKSDLSQPVANPDSALKELKADQVSPMTTNQPDMRLTSSEALTVEHQTASNQVTPVSKTLSRRARLNEQKTGNHVIRSKKSSRKGKRTNNATAIRPVKKNKLNRVKQQRRPQMTAKNGKRRFVWIVLTLVVLLVGILGWRGISSYRQSNDYSAMQPKNGKKQEVYIPQGATVQQIGQILVNKHLVHSNKAFLHYVSTHDASNMLAGYYQLSPSMPMKTLVDHLLKGGSDTPVNHDMVLTMTEGEGIASFAKKVGNSNKFTESDFLAKVNDQTFLEKLAKTYPKLLTSAMAAKDTRYRLEGYLYPATYDYAQYQTVEDLITAMVAKTDSEMQPYYSKIKKSNMSVQELMTVASLVQGEGVGDKDMRIIAGVFLNRLDINMPIQSDVAIKYALQTDRVNLSVDDTMVDSPFNLYRNSGYGPGPMNNPSIQAVKAVLNPKDRDKKYLFFVANLKTGAITYTKNQKDHDEAVAKVDKINQGMENR